MGDRSIHSRRSVPDSHLIPPLINFEVKRVPTSDRRILFKMDFFLRVIAGGTLPQKVSHWERSLL